jgi:hypothetical protein
LSSSTACVFSESVAAPIYCKAGAPPACLNFDFRSVERAVPCALPILRASGALIRHRPRNSRSSSLCRCIPQFGTCRSMSLRCRGRLWSAAVLCRFPGFFPEPAHSKKNSCMAGAPPDSKPKGPRIKTQVPGKAQKGKGYIVTSGSDGALRRYGSAGILPPFRGIPAANSFPETLGRMPSEAGKDACAPQIILFNRKSQFENLRSHPVANSLNLRDSLFTFTFTILGRAHARLLL